MTAVIIPFPKPKSIPSPGEVLDQHCIESGHPILNGIARRIALVGLELEPQARAHAASR